MDLLPGDSPQLSSNKKQRFRSLKLVNVNFDDLLPATPFGADYGRLSNGLTYYVRSNSKPKMRAALALAVKVGFEYQPMTWKKKGELSWKSRGSRNANARMQDAHWVLMMEGSKYTERLPIGLEKVIRTVSPENVKKFYNKWYHMQNMAVIAVGDFPDTENVVELIKTHFEDKITRVDPPIMP